MKRFGLLIVALLSLGLLAGCSSKPKAGAEADRAAGRDGSAIAGQGVDRLGSASGGLNDPYRDGKGGYDVNVEPKHRVQFDFNSALINEDASKVLTHNAGWIRAKRPKGQITVEGHCDERGTREYNLALGQQRADAVRQFLVTQGVDAKRLKSVSYGKERPLVVGRDESAWQENRRAELVIK